MAKRGAGDQLTKDDAERDGRDSDGEDPGQRDAPLAPIEGRKIRGMPKRGKGSGMTAPTPLNAPASESAPKPAFGGFSFGASSAAPTSTPSAAAPSFSFGASTTPSAPVSFGAPAAASATSAPAASTPFAGFSFGSTSTAPVAAPKPAAPGADAAAAKSPFSGFSFGAKPAASAAPTTSTSPSVPETKVPASGGFSFASSSATPAAPATSSSGFSFGSSSNATTNPAASAAIPPSSGYGFTCGAAPVSSSKPAEPAPSISQPSSSSSSFTPKPSSAEPPAEGQVSYYTSIRGLNTSILSFLTSTLESDAFVNLGEVLPGLADQYKKHLDETVKTAGWKPESSAPAPAKKAEEPKKTGFSMPAPPAGGFSLPSAPSGGFSFGGASAPAKTAPSTATSIPKGFTPSVAPTTSSSPFTFGAKPAETPKKPSAAVNKIVGEVLADKPPTEDKAEGEKKQEAPAPATFSFGASTSTPQPAEKKAGSSLFAFAPSGPLHPATPDSKSFSPSTNIESVSSSTPPAKLGKFGPGGSAPQLSFGGAGTTPGSVKSTGTGFGFGTPSSGTAGFSLGAGGASASGEKPSTGFSFSTPSASVDKTSSSSGFSFGSTSTAEKKDDKPAAPSFSFGGPTAASGSGSTGFSFGSSSTSTTTPSFSFGGASSTPAAPASSGFSLGSKPAGTSSPAPGGFAAFGSTAAATDNTPADSVEGSAEATPEPQGKNLAEVGGQGEEDEETVHQVRARLTKLEGGKWVVLGLGELRLKKAKDGKRRLLLRSDGGGNVILNMAVTASLDPKAENKSVQFIGADLEGKPMPCRLAIKTAESAKAFADAVKKEVEEVKKA